MSDIFKFQEEQTATEEECTCGMCNLLDETFDFIFNIAEDKDEIIDFLIDALQDAKRIGYEDAMKEIITFGVNSLDINLECTDGDCDEDCDCDI